MRRLSALCVWMALGSSCAKVGPDYEPPETPLPGGAVMPDRWHTAATMGLEVGESRLQTWWNAFDDPMLESLIQRAQRENLDLEQAVARVREARALVGIARGDPMPVVDAFVEDYRDVLVSLLAEVALAYVDVRSLQDRIELAPGPTWPRSERALSSPRTGSTRG